MAVLLPVAQGWFLVSSLLLEHRKPGISGFLLLLIRFVTTFERKHLSFLPSNQKYLLQFMTHCCLMLEGFHRPIKAIKV